MSYVYRCSACRTRNTFLRAVNSYVRVKKCRHCRHARFYVDRERIARQPCRCNAHHWPHRPGTTYCVLNPDHMNQRAMRAGVDELDLPPPVGRVATECPF